MPNKKAKWWQASHNKDYKPKVDMAILAIGSVIAIVFIMVALSSCNPTRKAYEGIKKHEPATTADSFKLATRFKTTYPQKPPVIKKGIPVVKPDSTAFFKKKLDSALKAGIVTRKAVEVKYKDTCTTAVDSYDDGYRFGYKLGVWDGQGKCPQSTNTVDTFIQDSQQTLAELAVAQNGLKISNDNLTKSLAEQAIYKHQSTVKTYWLIGLGLLIAIMVFLKIKKII
jgi:hypothetical protein